MREQRNKLWYEVRMHTGSQLMPLRLIIGITTLRRLVFKKLSREQQKLIKQDSAVVKSRANDR